MATRPAWVNGDLFPFESHFIDVRGAQVHYIDEGVGPVFLALHGNPTWSFLYRHIIQGLREQFRCVALDYPGFGLSTPPPGYRYTVAEHARVVEGFVEQLGLRDITLMVQDWGGPIGFWVASRHPDWFRAFVIGNTWAWPIRDDRSVEWFSKTLGSKQLGGVLVKQADVFVNVFMRGGIRRKRLSIDEQFMYRRPHPTPESREPVHVMPREILAAEDLLSQVEQGLARVSDKPALIVWGPKDPGFKEQHRLRWERTFPTTAPRSCPGRPTTSRRMRRTRSSPRSRTGGRGAHRDHETDLRASFAAGQLVSPPDDMGPLFLGRPLLLAGRGQHGLEV